jgi:hypothetical protein
VLVFEGGIVKVGRSKDPSTRVAQHVQICSLPLIEGHLYAVMDDLLAEAAMLRALKSFRLNDGEWFVIPSENRAAFYQIEKFHLEGVKFWPYCAHLPTCALCLALEAL